MQVTASGALSPENHARLWLGRANVTVRLSDALMDDHVLDDAT